MRQMDNLSVRIKRPRGGKYRLLVLICFALAALAGAWAGYQRFFPNNHRIVPDYGTDHPLFYEGKFMKQGALIEGDSIKLPLEAVRTLTGKEEIRYEAETESVILTTAGKVMRIQTDALTAKVNSKPVRLSFAPENVNDTLYVPLAPLQELYGVQASVSAATGAVTVYKAGDAVQQGEAVKEQLIIREKPSVRAPIIDETAKKDGDKIRVWGEENGWYLVQGAGGYAGYARKSDLTLGGIRQIEPRPEEPPFIAWKALGSKINLTWEAVYKKDPDPSGFPPLTGVNVISPTWFELVNGSGQIRSKADLHYVSWAHNRGIQLWAVFSNGFDPKRTAEALATAETRFSMIQQLLAYAKMYGLQGINIDFENVRTADKGNLVQFVRELSPMLHEQNLVVSIDVTPKSNSELWSLFLDRPALIKSVDYMVLMAYDEHWASSPKSGSVASLPWVSRAVERLIEEDGIPPAKLILGMPLYTRIWTETIDQNGKKDVSSKAVGMEHVRDLIAANKLTPVYDASTGQNYVEFTENGARNRIWIEDALSIKARVDLAKRFQLAGVATWNRSFQSDDIWKVISEALHKRP